METKITYTGGRFTAVEVPIELMDAIKEVGWRFIVTEPSQPTYEAVVSFGERLRLLGREEEEFVPLSVILNLLNSR